MKAIHVNWTKPYFERHRLRGYGFKTTRDIPSSTYDQPDYQILYTILSILYWKLHNGPIKLYTDSVGAAFYQQFNILDLYDEVNINFLNGYSKTNIDPAYFWTSGKIKCLANQAEPFVFLDQDMIIRSPLPDYIMQDDLTVTHWEIPRGYYYFEKEDWEQEISHIPFPQNYSTLDWSPNTSFLLFNNLTLLKEYHDWHKKLVDTKGASVPEWFWLLTDQGILGHVVREGDYKINTLTDKIYLADSNYGNSETRYKGQAENWYYPVSEVNYNKDTDISWEHVWIDKIHYGWVPEYKEKQTQRFFEEIIHLKHEDYLMHPRFNKYWDEYNSKNN
jgi:hypothetical protein